MRDHTTTGVDEVVLQARITRMARRDPDWEVRLSALDFVRDPSALDEIAAADSSLVVQQAAAQRCAELVEEVGELGLLALARDAAASRTRVAATRRISNPAALAQLATTQFDEQVRAAAVERITEEQVLCHVASNDAHWFVRLVAVGRVRASAALARIARRDANDAVRLAAHARLADIDTRPIPRQSI